MPTPAPPSHVGILAPMKPELEPLVEAAGMRPDPADPARYRGTVGRHRVTALQTGVGVANATRVARLLVHEEACDHVLVVGIAGGLDPKRPIGTVVVPESAHDLDRGLTYAATPFGPAVLQGKLVTADRLIEEPDQLDDLRDRGFSVIDMETAAIAAVCQDRGLGWSAYRGISDHTVESGVDADVLALTKPDGSADVAAVGKLLARHPTRARILAQLATWMQTAVAAAVDRALADLRA